jgi:DNA repair photolyase
MANVVSTPLPLFPDAAPPPAKGIARLAAQAPQSGKGHQVSFHSLAVRSVLNRSLSRRVGFAWTINPYRGCEFACRYCYARYTHEFMELRQPEDFEREIFLKQNAAWLLRQELHQVRPGEEIAVGTATDPYQPVERRARITQSLLEVLAEQRDLHIGLVTKSALIVRDIPLFQRIAARNHLALHLTITTPDAHLARILEPRAPRPDLRFGAVRRLRAAGLRAGILCSPLLPGLTDTGRALDAMAAAAKAADASFFHAQPLFLKPCSRETYFAFIRQHFPALEPMYRERFAASAFLPRSYEARIGALLEAVCRKHRLGRRRDSVLTQDLAPASASTPGPQLFPASALCSSAPERRMA